MENVTLAQETFQADDESNVCHHCGKSFKGIGSLQDHALSADLAQW